MFYVKTLEHEIELEPIHFGQKLRATIVRLLKEEVEGLALANYGFVVNVIEVPEDQIRSGIIEVKCVPMSKTYACWSKTISIIDNLTLHHMR